MTACPTRRANASVDPPVSHLLKELILDLALVREIGVGLPNFLQELIPASGADVNENFRVKRRRLSAGSRAAFTNVSALDGAFGNWRGSKGWFRAQGAGSAELDWCR